MSKALSLAWHQTQQYRQQLALTLLVSVFILFQMLTTASAAPASFADLSESVSDSVVKITTTSEAVENTMPDLPEGMVPEGSPFEDFFREFQDRNGGNDQRRRPSEGLGSGFVISEDGLIVTNNHVIEDADEIMVEFLNGESIEATLVGTDPKTDIAVLKVDADRPLPVVAFGNSDEARVGEWVIAVGNPLGQMFSVSAGIISARGRSLSGAYDDYIQTDAAINRGNSGGPLFNMDGKVIGVNTAILSPTGGSIGIGFSMASNVVSKVVDQLIEYGETRRGWLGVRIQDISQDMADALGMDNTKGVLVSEVPEGPAKEAGILAGDVILSFDGQDVSNTRELVAIVGDAAVGAKVRTVILRDGETQTILVTLGRRETEEASAFPTPEPQAPPAKPQNQEINGMTLSPITPAVREGIGLDAEVSGVVVMDIDAESDAFEKGLRRGDIIREVGRTPVETPADVEAGLAAAKDAGRNSVLLLVLRDGDTRFVAVAID